MSLLNRWALQARRRRFALLQAALPDRPCTILDVGGTLAYWQAMPAVPQGQITLFNLAAEDVPMPFVSIAGDACDLSRFPDQSVDIVFSNSVIGHVGDFHRQQRMAAELQRVGKTVVLQTPNQWFPLDWHTQVPCFHWLPRRLQAWCFAHFRVGTYPKAASAEIAHQRAHRIRNLTARELRELFPGATLIRERVGGFTKSFIVSTAHGTYSYAPMSHAPSDPRVFPSGSTS